jgi:hypothetical protein
MESEKVKEIKKALAQNSGYIHFFNEYEVLDDVAYTDILTLINELESENETLRNAKVVYETVDYCAEDLRKAQDRIAELETEIKENAFYSKGYAQGIKNTYEIVVPDKLKQFAERLKETAYKSTDWSHGEHPLVVEVDYIDEVLEEFIKDVEVEE